MAEVLIGESAGLVGLAEKVQELVETNHRQGVVEVDGRHYWQHEGKVVELTTAATLDAIARVRGDTEAVEVGTLESLVEVAVSVTVPGALSAIVVTCPARAELFATQTLLVELHEEVDRRVVAASDPLLPGFLEGHWLTPEAFRLMLLRACLPAGDRDELLLYIARIKDDVTDVREDDGVSQSYAAVASGPKAAGETAWVPVPGRVILQPWRTFHEVDQPSSVFTFRMRKGRSGPELALFEADGGMWRLEAMRSVKGRLEELLADAPMDLPVLI
ncbi:MAG: hypothetical protein AAGN46_05525 [Acidobacteriota bacterium]